MASGTTFGEKGRDDAGKQSGEGHRADHPPAAKACEAPGGPARLAGALRRHGVPCRIWDANLEGQLALLKAAAACVYPGAGAPSHLETGEQNRGTSDLWAPSRGRGMHLGGERPSAVTTGRGTSRRRERGGRDDDGRPDTWTRRAARHLSENLNAFRSWTLYGSPDRYRRAAADVNRLLAMAARPYGVRLSLADYEDEGLSPVRSADLIEAAAAPGGNPFYPWFSERLFEVIGENPPLYAGFSVNYLSQALTAFAMIGFLRRVHPRVGIVLGGSLITSWMRNPTGGTPFAASWTN